MVKRNPDQGGLLLSFLVQAAANALGTVASGVLLGSVRVGILDVQEDTLQLTARRPLGLGGAIVVLSVIAAITFGLLTLIEPQRRSAHGQTLLRLLQVAAAFGILATTLFWGSLMIVSWDLEALSFG